MKSKLLNAAVASILFASAGIAAAAEPLSDTQLDTVAAGEIASASAGLSSALIGFATTASTTEARVTRFSLTTESTSVALAAGLFPVAATAAASVIR